jgi:hypothetical protein
VLTDQYAEVAGGVFGPLPGGASDGFRLPDFGPNSRSSSGSRGHRAATVRVSDKSASLRLAWMECVTHEGVEGLGEPLSVAALEHQSEIARVRLGSAWPTCARAFVAFRARD